jgi:DNA repair protein RadD
MSQVLRDYQKDVIDRVRARLREGCRRVLIQAPTGAGKTTVSSEIVRCAAEKGKRSLFLAHRRRLVQQKCDRLEDFGVPYGVLMSDDPRRRPSAPAQVASRDTLLSRGGLPPADLIIVDEARHGMSDGYAGLLAAYPDAVVIGLDATPARSDGRGLGDFYQAIECTAPTSQLIRDGHLVPVRCYAPDRGKGARRGLTGDPVANWRLYAEGRPTVLFTTRVAESRAAVEAFNAAGVPAEHIDARTPDDGPDGRDAVVERLRSGRTKVVSNCAIWTEGVDVPELSCCQLLRVAGSYVLFAQCVGRVMRPAPGKADAVLIDHSGACLKHGLPGQDVEWTLSPSESVDQRNAKARKEGKRARPVVCPKCFFLFTGCVVCPACGHKLPRRSLPAETRHELLVEVLGSMTPEQRREREVRDWRHFLAVAHNRGGTLAQAQQMWRKEHGKWPDGGLPMPPAQHLLRRPVSEVYPECVRRRGVE